MTTSGRRKDKGRKKRIKGREGGKFGVSKSTTCFREKKDINNVNNT